MTKLPECVVELQKCQAAQMPSAVTLLQQLEEEEKYSATGMVRRFREEQNAMQEALDSRTAFDRLLDTLYQPLSLPVAREWRDYGRVIASDASLPKYVREPAAAVSVKAEQYVSKAEFEALGLEVEGLKKDNQELKGELKDLTKQVRRYIREEAASNGKLECKRRFDLLVSGAEACGELGLLGAEDKPLRGEVVAAFFNGEREGGRAVVALFTQPNGEKYEDATLHRYIRDLPDHPAPPPSRRPRKTDWKTPEMLRYLEKWWLAGLEKADTQPNTENGTQFPKAA